ncbi:hypothetical protein Tco_0733092 [Tanacetum coccineum]
MARLWDLRTLRSARLLFSSFKSLAIMTGYLVAPSKNAYSRWGGQFLEFNLVSSSNQEDSTVLLHRV